MSGRRLLSRDDAVDAKTQHHKPCSDCPWARTALNGWLGGGSIEEWLRTAHGDNLVDCHTLRGAQCAGIAIYRRNVSKLPGPPNLRLDVDRDYVFASPAEFRHHHESPIELREDHDD